MARFVPGRVLCVALMVSVLLPALTGARAAGAATPQQSAPPTSIYPNRPAVSGALMVSALLSRLTGAQAAGSAAPQQSAPPTFVDPNHPTVSGTLVAKPVSGEGNIPAACLDRDVRAVRAAVTQNRGLVICTEEGKLVLLQLSPGTRYYSRDWVGITISRMKDGDHINAWGTPRDAGHLLYPTRVVQDTSVLTPPPPKLTTVAGILVAKPVSGEGTIASVCRDRNEAAVRQAVQQNRGLVLCTEEGRLVLLELSAGTRLISRDGRLLTVALLTDGDHLTATGVLEDGGHLLDPTARVQDSDLQGALTESQDFIAQGGPSLTLYVLKSDAGGPVQGIVHAVRGDPVHVILCGGRAGAWGNLTQGKTIDVTQSLFNRRTMSYVDTDTVRVISCP